MRFTWVFAFTGILSTFSTPVHAGSASDFWYFTPNEIEIAYRYQASYGKGLQQPLRARTCVFGAKQFPARYFDKRVQLPCRFITNTLRHLREILEIGAARYLFPLDLDHAHLAIPKKSWVERYSKLKTGEILPAMLKDPRLLALYHSAEHLKITDHKTGRTNIEAREWMEKRNILGYYDGRPVEILPPRPKGVGASIPNRYHGYGGFDFLASQHGRLAVILEDEAVEIDIKLQLGGNDSGLR